MSGGMVGSYMLATRKSAYHDNCVPADRRDQATQVSADKKRQEGDYVQCDAVKQDTIWKESVTGEKRCLKNWSSDWGFLTDFDSKGDGITMGNQIERDPLPEKASIFSSDMPNTNSGNYGSRVNTDVGRQMQNLEYKFYAEKRRRKLGNDLVCY
ncbi:uncharacterized protein C2orf50-like isoform X1 [Mytilus californianus]|uniref:uncharacterized protein C2orf50-like isoform X1 n=1 Tax=Mytilus californianus TaxID=6549 RepID=UPI0022452568|nr:uncharacterized protein C2orf50-like isoform X1 [Mytilus californianus]